jgi:phospholipase A1
MVLPRMFLLLVLLGVAAASSAEWLVRSPQPRVDAGGVLEVEIILLNDTKTPVAGGMPVRLPATLNGDASTAAITLEAVQPPADLAAPLAPGMFRKQHYRAQLPAEFSGTARLTLDRTPGTSATIVVENRSAAPAAPATLAANIRADTVPEPVLSPYEPMYFLMGPSGTNTARFQFSFKYRLFDERGVPAKLFAPLGKAHFGYTQTSLWDIGGTSSPFRDTSYKPSLFYYEPQIDASADGRYLMGLQAGIEHESNGRDGARSRSINIAYIKPSWRWFIDDEHYFSVAPKIYSYLERADNNDIGQYRGHVDLELRYGKRDGWLFSSLLRKGNGSGYSAQLDASYPLRQPFFANAGGYIHFQYFNGYGETLLDYNVRRSPQFRIGFSIVR